MDLRQRSVLCCINKEPEIMFLIENTAWMQEYVDINLKICGLFFRDSSS